MKPTHLLLAALVLSGCGDAKPSLQSNNVEYGGYKGEVYVITVNGCQYVASHYHPLGSYGSSGGICHAGNCSNPIHYPCDTLRY